MPGASTLSISGFSLGPRHWSGESLKDLPVNLVSNRSIFWHHPYPDIVPHSEPGLFGGILMASHGKCVPTMKWIDNMAFGMPPTAWTLSVPGMLGNVVGPPLVGIIFDLAQTHGVPMPYFWALVHPILLLLMILWLLRFVPEQARMMMLVRVYNYPQMAQMVLFQVCELYNMIIQMCCQWATLIQGDGATLVNPPEVDSNDKAFLVCCSWFPSSPSFEGSHLKSSFFDYLGG